MVTSRPTGAAAERLEQWVQEAIRTLSSLETLQLNSDPGSRDLHDEIQTMLKTLRETEQTR